MRCTWRRWLLTWSAVLGLAATAAPGGLYAAEPSAGRALSDYATSTPSDEEAAAAIDEYFISQPAAAAPSFSATPSTPPSEPRRSARSQYVRLARAPNMFGDSLSPTGGFFFRPVDVSGQVVQFTTDLPLGAGSVAKIAENNKALPADRVYFVYNGFKNARDNSTSSIFSPTPVLSDGNIDRYTLGFEKTYFDGMASLEIRMPLLSGFNSTAGGNGTLTSGNVGDLTFFSKQVLYIDDETVLAAGLGVSLPTASDVHGDLVGVPISIDNGIVRLLPYIGFMTSPSDEFFVQGFFELDFAANGHEIVVNNRQVGTLTPQNLLHVNFSLGRWIYEDYEARYLQRIALVGELHYATTIQDTDSVSFFDFPASGSLGNFANRVDYLNLTAGLQFQIGPMSNLRVACVTPLRDDYDRQFDAEIQVSFNRNF